ncbi:MarR family winged helix-turn-helix transcriptional regulator [Gayadomonas joobiniege]|uniref:MarR family winged helix-turn-helix transcriptional regulator n=1 Tax=Gayadomonas joobiniege TaxID=1234606 RepID=UPI00036FED09|nr:MarR family transcriptional regulator [Gayadomonas joobiniege]
MQARESIFTVIEKFKLNWPDCGERLNPYFLKMYRIHELLQAQIENYLAGLGLQKADFSLMTALRRSEHPYVLSPTELSQSMVFSSGGLTKVIMRLDQKGYIKRLDNPDDKRSRLVALTEIGKHIVEETMSEVQKMEQNSCPLTEQECDQLVALLDKLLHKLERE